MRQILVLRIAPLQMADKGSQSPAAHHTLRSLQVEDTQKVCEVHTQHHVHCIVAAAQQAAESGHDP